MATSEPPTPRIYGIYGLAVASDISFTNRLATADPPADITLRMAASRSHPSVAGAPAYVSPPLAGTEEGALRAYRLGGSDLLLRFAEGTDFHLGHNSILCHAEPAGRALLETQLLGTVLSCWLERSGLPCLHAAAVVTRGQAAGQAIGFLAGNGGGKSSLAASLMETGHSLLTDDLLVLEIGLSGARARAGYPQMRLWPAEAERFHAPAVDLPRVHPEVDKLRLPVGRGGLGEFHPGAVPLACLYLPRRAAGSAIAIEPIPPREAVIELARHSFIPRIVVAMGWQARRFDLFARLAATVPMRRLTYPSGFEHLPRVCAAIVADAARLTSLARAPQNAG